MRSVLVVILILFSLWSFGQADKTYESVDSITYSQYISKEYKQLQKAGKKSLKQGIDFYFLRMRLGVSYFEQKNYEKAITHFEKAYKMNPADSTVQEYLYYAFLFTQRKEDANDLVEKCNERFQNKIGFKKIKIEDIAGSFESLSVTAGALVNDNISKNENTDFKGKALYSENTLQGNSYLANIYLENRASNRLSFFNSFSYFNIQSLGIVQSKFTPTEKRNYSNNNYQYNIGGKYVFKKNYTVGATFGYYNESSNLISSKLDMSNFSVTFSNNSYKINTYSGTLFAFKRVKNYGFGLSGSIGSLSNVKQSQIEGNVVWYPFGNSNFYSSTSFTWLNNNGTDQTIFTQKIGGKALRNIWYEVKGSYGNHQNYISNSGTLAYNTVEPINWTTEANLSFVFSKFKIIPSYTLQQRESSYTKYFNLNKSEIIKKNYINHLIKFTVQWDF